MLLVQRSARRRPAELIPVAVVRYGIMFTTLPPRLICRGKPVEPQSTRLGCRKSVQLHTPRGPRTNRTAARRPRNMITTPTVLVLGPGASGHLRFPPIGFVYSCYGTLAEHVKMTQQPPEEQEDEDGAQAAAPQLLRAPACGEPAQYLAHAVPSSRYAPRGRVFIRAPLTTLASAPRPSSEVPGNVSALPGPWTSRSRSPGCG